VILLDITCQHIDYEHRYGVPNFKERV